MFIFEWYCTNEKYHSMSVFYQRIAQTLQNARFKASQAVNFTMVKAYWNVGRQIVEEEQDGKHRAEYGQNLIYYLSKRLGSEFGTGFDRTNLQHMRNFFLFFQIATHCVANYLGPTTAHFFELATLKRENFTSKKRLPIIGAPEHLIAR